MKPLNENIDTRNRIKHLAAAFGMAATVFFGTGPEARADLIGHWISGASDLIETSGIHPAGTHDGVAVGPNAGALAFSADVPPGYTGQSLDLQAGNVGVMVQNSANTDAGYLSTYDDGIQSQFTIAFWAKGFPGGWAGWVSKRGEDGIGWQVRRMGGDSIAGFTMRGIDNEDGWGSSISVNDSPAKWHHFAGVWNQATGTRTLYVDGVFSHIVSNGGGQVMTLAADKHLGLGARQGGGADFEGYFSGLLFDVRLYNQPLSQSEVIALIPPPIPEGLVATPGNGKIALTWSPSIGATSYTVWTMHSVTEEVQTDVATASPFTKDGLTNGTRYFFKVLASNSAGSSEYSMEVDGVPEPGSAKDMLTFNFGSLGSSTILDTTIIKHVPMGTNVTALAPTYTVSPYATEDAAHPSGSARDFTSPQTYTVTAENGTTKVYTVTVVKSAPMVYDFNNGLQGWTQIWPMPLPTGLWENGHVGAGHDGGETRFARSPEFYLNNLSGLTFQLAGGQSPLAVPSVYPDGVPELAIDGGGFAGVALRDVEADTYVLSKRRGGSGDAYQGNSFTTTDLAPYANDGRKYTVDYLDYNKGGWGWTYMDNVSIPGTPAPAANITSFSLYAAAAIMGEAITLSVPFGTPLTALAPTYTMSPGATCAKASGSTQDFTSPVTYTVLSSDTLVSRTYTVSVVVLPDPATTLVGQWFAGEETLADTSGYTSAGTHDGVAIGGNAGSLAFNADDVPLQFSGSSLDLTAGNVGVMINNSATTDTGYLDTYDGASRDQLTVAFWAKGFPGVWGAWVSKRGEDGIGWQVRRFSDTNFACFTLRGVADEDGPGSTINVNESNAIWHHFAGVWDQSTGTRSLYVDGVLSHVTSNVIGQMMGLAEGKHLALGARQTGGEDFDSYFAGRLYDVRIYHQVLFADQIQTVMTTPTTVQAPEAKIRSFGLPGVPAVIVGTDILWTLPLGMDVTALAPTFTLSLGATCDRVSGATLDFSGPLSFTVTSSDSQVNVYTATVVFANNFNDGTLQGWHNRVWDATAGAWTDLEPNVTTMPATINDGVIQPPSADNYLFAVKDGVVVPSGGQNDNHLNTIWLRSPQFYLDGSGDLTVQLAKGIARTSPPANESEVPYAAVTDAGWMGVVLCRVSDGSFLLAKSKTQGQNDAMWTTTFTESELAPFVGLQCTVNVINSDRGGWGWLTMDNVSIPGGITQTVLPSPYWAWMDANYPDLADKSPVGDPDSDGMNNHAEFAFGLDPSDGGSVNPITVPLDKGTGTFRYTRRSPAVTELTYSVDTSVDLVNWWQDTEATLNQTVVATDGDVQTVEVTLSGLPLTDPSLFVSVRAD
ncbi:MAG: hypothetical protein K9N23_03980 [Akkermansiaceae bacterium]|nr:hypothetical protein [Akkermansiaceae bacterium]